MAGKDVSHFVQKQLRDRDEPVTPEESFAVAKAIKEQLCYTCPDVLAEFQKYDAVPNENFKNYVLKNGSSIDVGYERFLAPEIFFNPEMIGNDTTKPLPELVDDVIQSCPIDGRRGLYNVRRRVVFFLLLEHRFIWWIDVVQGFPEASSERYSRHCGDSFGIHDCITNG